MKSNLKIVLIYVVLIGVIILATASLWNTIPSEEILYSDIRAYLRPKALAMERAIEVLPTPGGPTKHSTGPFISPLIDSTAKCSNTRFFTSSNP